MKWKSRITQSRVRRHKQIYSSVPCARHPLSNSAIPFEGPHTYMWKYPPFRLPQLRHDEEEGEGCMSRTCFMRAARFDQAKARVCVGMRRVCGHEDPFRRPSGDIKDER